MFRKNESHLQPPLFSEVQSLPKKVRQRLEASWAGVFYQECFSRINEETLAVLYADEASRPNVPVNVLAGLECLKAGFGWSDEEMYDNFLYNIQVRYGLGLHELNSGHFELRTIYNFRRRLVQYRQEKGIDLMVNLFAQMTKEQIAAFKVRTGMQRMDSSQISSDMADISRLQLVVEGLVRLSELLDESQRAEFSQQLAPYLKYKPQQFAYHIKGQTQTQEQLQAVGTLLAQLLVALADKVSQEDTYQLVTRLFEDNYQGTMEAVVVKANDEIASGALQSLSDREATFRRKGGEGYKGYVYNISQTCDPANELQLITHIQTAPNNVDDANLLIEALPTLTEQTEIETLYSDGGFGSPDADQALQNHGVDLHQTALRGKAPDPDHYCLADFQMSFDEEGRPTYIACPKGQIVPVLPARKTGFFACFDKDTCLVCPAFEQGICRVRLLKSKDVCQLNFTQEKAFWARRRRRYRRLKTSKGDPRAAIEATVRTIKHPFRGKLPVRGLARVSDVLTASAIMSNVRSILRFHKRKRRTEIALQTPEWQQEFRKNVAIGCVGNFLSRLPRYIFRPFSASVSCFSC